MISVLVPQNRPGGLDVLLSGLAVQTYRDFELVLIDDLRAFRGHLVHDYAKQYDLRVTHVAPWQVPQLPCSLYEPGHYQRALNTGLAHARGDVCVVLCDYTYLHPEALAIHAAYQESVKGCALLGTLECVDVKPLVHPDFPNRYGWYAMGHNPADHVDATFAPSYQPWMSSASRLKLMDEWMANYTADLESGALDSYMWTVFGEPVTPDTDLSKLRVWQTSRGALNGKVHHQHFNLKNDSIRTDALLAVSGFDEELDGCHGHQDSELAGRLEAQLGMEYWVMPQCRGWLFDPHGIAILRGMRKAEDHNLKTYSAKFDGGGWTGGAAFDLAARRKELSCARTD